MPTFSAKGVIFMQNMFIFNQTFTATSKKTGLPFYAVKMFERRETQEKAVYFKEVQCFVEKPVFDSIVKGGFRFGDIVDVKTGAPQYFGGPEQLVGLELLQESPYYEA